MLAIAGGGKRRIWEPQCTLGRPALGGVPWRVSCGQVNSCSRVAITEPRRPGGQRFISLGPGGRVSELPAGLVPPGTLSPRPHVLVPLCVSVSSTPLLMRVPVAKLVQNPP